MLATALAVASMTTSTSRQLTTQLRIRVRTTAPDRGSVCVIGSSMVDSSWTDIATAVR
jgi:hypothetical protein